MAQRLMTPGVYIEEVNAFPGSVVEVATAIPAFIGYTEKASRNGKDLENQPVRITSIAEYHNLFGGAFFPKFTLDPPVSGKIDKHKITIEQTEIAINYQQGDLMYMLYRGLQLFFSNGGGACYIVSIGKYKAEQVEIKKEVLEAGLNPLLKEQEPTMVVVPDAVKLSADECYDLYKKVLAHCAKMQSRVAILDVYRGDEIRVVDYSDPNVDIITNFRESIGSENLNYAAAYYPWLNTNIIPKGEITFENINTPLITLLPKKETDAIGLVKEFPTDDAGFLMNLKKDKADDFKKALDIDLEKALKINPQFKLPTEPPEVKKPKVAVQPKEVVTEPKPVVTAPTALAATATDQDKAKFNEATKKFEEYEEKRKAFVEYDKARQAYADNAKNKAEYETYLDNLYKYYSALNDLLDTNKLTQVKSLLPDYKKNKNRNYHQGLIATSPTYSQLLEEIRTFANILPPAAAMAGIYTMVDNNRGVWKSPANVSLNSVLKPTANITHDEQENLNVDATSGKSINAIRTFPGIGTLVWGGRTLDGNSLDWKYINVRRTMIMLEQSIKMALRSYVFEPNDANTWVSVKSMIVNYLTEKWKQGALAGASPDDAFEVNVGLGATMTGLDILEGKMLVSVKLAIVRPAEFIVVTFEQQMQKS